MGSDSKQDETALADLRSRLATAEAERRLAEAAAREATTQAHQLETALRDERAECDRLRRQIDERASVASEAGAGHAGARSLLQLGEEPLRLALETSRMVVWEWHLETGEMIRSAPMPEFAGPPVATTWCSYTTLIHPDDRPIVQEALDRSIETSADFRAEYRLVGPPGAKPVWIADRARVSTDANGRPIKLNGVASDISDRKAIERRQDRLLTELQHRVKNILATVRSLASQTLRGSRSLGDFGESFSGRIDALALTQNLLTRSHTEEIDLQDLVREELLPFGEDRQDGMEVSGPDILLRPKAAQILGLAIHELATNAVKFGALAGGNGHLSVAWELADGEASKELRFTWQESGLRLRRGKPRRGFGTEFIQRGLAYQFDARTSFDLRPQGLYCLISIPLNERFGRLPAAVNPVEAS